MTRSSQAGSTLLEVLIALAVMSMTAAIMVSFLGGYGRSIAHSAKNNAELNRALDRREFRELLEMAHFGLMSGRSEPIEFLGLTSSLQFSAFDTVTGDLVRVELNEDDDKGFVVQVIGIGRFNASQNRKLFLGEMSTDIEIEYYGGPTQDGVFWKSKWQNELVLPRLVRITFIGPYADIPLMSIWPGKTYLQREMSLSSLLPP